MLFRSEYIEGDPTPAHAALKAANRENTDDFMRFSRQMIIDQKLATGRDADGGLENICRISAARFREQIQQLEELEILPKGKVTVGAAMTTDFLPARAATP